MNMLVSEKFNLASFKASIASFITPLKKMKIGILDGLISEEEVVYNPTANLSDLELASIVSVFEEAGLTYEIIDMAQDGWLVKLAGCDPIVINIHGEFGEDGKIQGLLETLGKQYIGSDVEASGLTISKSQLKLVMYGLGIQTSKFYKEEWKGSPAVTPLESLRFPIMAKIDNGGCSIGMEKINDEAELKDFKVRHANKLHRYFFEEFIIGRFLTVGIMQVDDDYLAFPPLEVVTRGGFYDISAKADHGGAGLADYVFPDDEVCRDGGELQKIAYEIFIKSGCRNFGRVDFMVDEQGNAYLLEINNIAGLSSSGNFSTAGKKIGLTYSEILINIIKAGMDNTPYKSPHPKVFPLGMPLELEAIIH